MGTDAQNPTPTPAPASGGDWSGGASVITPDSFKTIPGQKIADPSTIHALPKDTSMPESAPAHAHGIAPNGEYADFGDLNPVENLNKLTEPIEHYTQEGRAKHPVLSRVGDFTRNVKEALEGGQAAGKPMGTTGSPIVAEANLLSGAADAAGAGEWAENLVSEYGAGVMEHPAAVGKAFLNKIGDEGYHALNHIDFHNVAGHEHEPPTPPHEAAQPAPQPKPKPQTRSARAELQMAESRHGGAGDMEKNPTSIPIGAPKHVEIVSIDPQRFIDNVNPSGRIESEPTVQKYQQRIRNGEDIDPAKIEYNPQGGTNNGDGRHRAEASRREGVPLKVEVTRQLYPGQDPQADAEAARELAAHNAANPIYELNGDEDTLDMAERQSALKQPYQIEVGKHDGTSRIETVEGFSTKDALKTAQKKFPDGQEWGIANERPVPGERTPTKGYNVPTGKHLSLPAGSRPVEQVMRHELGHALVGQNEGLVQEGILRHTHPDLGGRGAVASVRWPASELYEPGTRLIREEKLPGVINTFMGGIASDEVFNDIPRAANHNFDHELRGSDAHQAYNFLAEAGYPHEEIMTRLHAGVDSAKEYLTQPEVSDIIRENAGTRERGLSNQYHYSEERLNQMHAEAQRRIQNGTPDNRAIDGSGHPNGQANDAGTEGQTAGTVGRQTAGEVTPEDEYHPDLRAVADKYGVSSDPYKTAHGASFIAPDGQYIHGSGVNHEQMIGGPDKGEFVNRTGAIRVRAVFDRNGHTLHVSVPNAGVTPREVDALKAAAHATLKHSGTIVMETADGAQSITHDFANANNIEPMLKEIGAHPSSADEAMLTAEKKPKAAPEPWAEKASQDGENNGGFTINPRTGVAPTGGHVLEAVPESRQVSDTPNTPEQIQKFATKNKRLLNRYPELQVGGYKNDAGKYELNLSAISHDPLKAEKVAKALDQESYYDVAAGKTVPTGGKNLQTKFPDYPIAQRLRELVPEEPGMTISTRQPSSVMYSTEDPMRHNLRLTGDLIHANPELADKWAEAVRQYPGFQDPEGADTQTTLNAFIEHAKDNIKHLYNSLPPEMQEKNKVWYDGAHTLTKELADKHGLTHPQTAGIVAALSPQKDWDQNVSLARRLTDIVKNQQDSEVTPEMVEKAQKIMAETKTKKNPNANKELAETAKRIQGQKFKDLDSRGKAVFVRLHDEIVNPKEYFKINADGSNGGVFTKLDGTNGQVAWGSLGEIQKAINIAEDGSRANISANLGQAHKVRHFYNNIIEPNSARGDVTVDTHAVAAALMRGLTGKDAEVLTNFGGPSSNVHGLNGTYPLYHEAYTRAAKELDIQYPRQLQSVVWEHIRNLFPAEFKTDTNKDAIDAIWKEAQSGNTTAKEARDKIIEYAKLHAGLDEEKQRPINAGELFRDRIHGEPAGGLGRGDRGGSAVGNQETRPPEQSAPQEVKQAETTQPAGRDWTKILADSNATAKAKRLKK